MPRVGVVPAHEGFHAHDGPRHAVALGLQIEAELFVLQRTLQLAQPLLALFELVQHGGQLLGQWCIVVVFLLFAPFLVALEVGFVNGRHAPLPFGVCSQKRLLMRQERILIQQYIQVRRSTALPFGHLVVSFSIRSVVRAGPTAHSVWSRYTNNNTKVTFIQPIPKSFSSIFVPKGGSTKTAPGPQVFPCRPERFVGSVLLSFIRRGRSAQRSAPQWRRTCHPHRQRLCRCPRGPAAPPARSGG